MQQDGPGHRNTPGPPAAEGFADLGFARLDVSRRDRTGDPEVVYGAGKTVEQAVALVAALRAAHPDRPALITRASGPIRDALRAAYGAEAIVDGQAGGRVCVLTAGTSDAAVAAEAAFTARVHGAAVDQIADVGVAGLHRLLAVLPRLAGADCLVVVAGMDGALPSAVGGLTGLPLVAVPTSVGYGASFGGLAPLLAMLNSCAPGVVVTNIDNGFGAGVFAARVARRSRAGETPSTAPGRTAAAAPAPGEISTPGRAGAAP